MYLNRFVFPAPQCSYNEEAIKENLVWVERPKDPSKQWKGLQRSREETKEATPNDIQRKGSLDELNPRNSINSPQEEDEAFNSLFASLSDLAQNTHTHPNNIINSPEVGETPKEENLSPRMSLEKIEMKVIDYSHQGHYQKRPKRGGCFGFFSKTKAKTTIPTQRYSLSTRTSNVSVKANHEEMRNDSPYEEEECKERSLSEPKIPKLAKIIDDVVKIPCLYLTYRSPTKKTLLFFHSNGEDIYLTYELLKYISDYLLVNVFAVEYPGYGIYKGTASEKNVLLDAEAAYNYLIHDMNCREEDIIIAGRSLGTGPATWLASFTNPCLLVLISPFTSIRGVVKHAFGSTARYLIKERFNNLKKMPLVKCPVFILHGRNDELIPYDQASQLYDAVKGPKKLYIANEMDHASFDFLNDLIRPLKSFMDELKGPQIIRRRSRVLPSKIFKHIPVIEIKNLSNIV